MVSKCARRIVVAALVLLGAVGAGARELPREPATRDPTVRAKWLVELGDAYLENGAVAKACRAFEDATVVLPAWWIARLNAVKCGRLVGAPIEALLEHLRQAEAAFPRGPLIPLQRGILYEDQGDLDAARAAYRAAMELAPWMREARRRLAEVSITAGDHATARAVLEGLVAEAPRDLIARTRLADVYVMTGEASLAAAQLEEVVLGSAFPRRVRVRLVRLYESLGATKDVERTLRALDAGGSAGR